MRTAYYQQSRKSPWFKWVLVGILLIILACLTYLIVMYNSIQQDKQTGFNETKEMVLQQTDIAEINNIKRYHGEHAYHIVFGQTDNNEKQIVFVPLTKENEEENFTVIDQADIISQEAIEEKLQNECNTCKIISIIPAMEDEELLWELTYVDDSNRYVLEYLSLYDATQYEQFRFKQMYK